MAIIFSMDSEGNLGPLTPGDHARYDQAEAKFLHVASQLMTIHAEIRRIILHSAHPQEAAHLLLPSVHEKLGELLGEAFSDDEAEFSIFSFVMFLIDRLCVAKSNSFEEGEAISEAIMALSTVLPESHPLHVAVTPLIEHMTGDGSKERFLTPSSGQVLGNVHRADECTSRDPDLNDWCVIHRPIPGPWSLWGLEWRGDDPFDIRRGFERTCPHGSGHPAVEELLLGRDSVHGCCGECPCSPSHCDPVFSSSDFKLLGYKEKE